MEERIFYDKKSKDLVEEELLNLTVEKIKNAKLKHILLVQQVILRSVDEFMYKRGIVRMMPLMMAPITDTLNHSVEDCSLTYQGQNFEVMKSMIFHKQLALMNPEIDSLYIVSPNIRLERAERGDARHLFEFTQVDFEFKNGTMEKVFSFMEDLITYVFGVVKAECKNSFKALGIGTSHLDVSAPFKIYRTEELQREYGPDYEHIASRNESEPFWLVNHKREFYDAEEPGKKGVYRNYDLIWPLGYEEGLSGGEREFEYSRLMTRMKELNVDEKAFRNYIRLAKRGDLLKTAGAGFGVERMTRFVCRQKEIDDVTVFSRKPGKEFYIF